RLQVEIGDQFEKQKRGSELSGPEVAIEERTKADGLVLQYLKQLSDLEQTVDLFKQRAADPEKEPGYRTTLAQIDAAKATLAARRQEIRPRITKELQEQARV